MVVEAVGYKFKINEMKIPQQKKPPAIYKYFVTLFSALILFLL